VATLTHSELETLWVLSGGLQPDADTAAAIAEAESKGCQYAKAGPNDDRPIKQCTYRRTNGENSYGLWQINRRAHPQYSATSLFTTEGNAAAAVAIRTARGNFTDWTTFKDGTYKVYLTGTVSVTPQPGTTSGFDLGATIPHALSGFADLRNSVNRHLPTQLDRSRRTGLVTLRTIGRKAKVGR
jgi:Lysozyme like domain